ncbi:MULTISPECIES: M23 family metallopeptidase [Phenylobacterium]|uniref:M23ase beta-sheet core domain-containing protein n=1 Tax=Phenylobacterium koreense TaxID=266125 RepID=A0ABV2EHM3_9CAUL
MTLAAHGGMRHFWAEGLVAFGLTLSLAGAAYGTAVISPRLADHAVAPAPVAAPAPAVAAPLEPEPAFDFAEPVPGHGVNSPFGLRRMPWENHGRLHEGVDIAAPSGARVVAVEDGMITRAGTSSSYGRFVEIRHAHGLTSLYAHLGRIDPAAQAGAPIKAGVTLGRIGSTGVSTGPHLHFELRRDDKPLNPTAFIGREFDTLADLPLRAASYYSHKVRVVHGSKIPASKTRAMAAKKANDGEVKTTKEGRVMATLQVARCDEACAAAKSAPSEVAAN